MHDQQKREYKIRGLNLEANVLLQGLGRESQCRPPLALGIETAPEGREVVVARLVAHDGVQPLNLSLALGLEPCDVMQEPGKAFGRASHGLFSAPRGEGLARKGSEG